MRSLKVPPRILLLVLLPQLPFPLAAQTNMYAHVAPADQARLKSGLDRYVRDQETQNWPDLFEIAVSGFAMNGNYDDPSGKNEPILSKQQFVHAMEASVESGVRPIMQSFDLHSITPVKGGYEVRACSKSQRESFSFKGILRLNAYVSDDQMRFGGWTYVYAMPHSCSQTTDSY